MLCRSQGDRQDEINRDKETLAELATQVETLTSAAAETEAEMKRLQGKKVQQSGGKMNELTDAVNELQKQ